MFVWKEQCCIHILYMPMAEPFNVAMCMHSVAIATQTIHVCM